MAHLVCHPSIFNSFPVIQTASAKNRRFHVFTAHILGSPGDVPATTNCLAACAHLSITVSEIQRDICEKIGISSYPLAFDAPVRGVPVEISAPPLVWQN